MKKRVIYYKDLVNDEFSGVAPRADIKIDENYKYEYKNIFYKIGEFIVYKIVMRTFAWIYCKLKFSIKIIGKDKLKPLKHNGYFMFGNHTQVPGDGFLPNVMTFPKNTCFIVNKENVAAKGTKILMTMLGTIPIPTERNGFKKFNQTIEAKIKQNNTVVIYPEAHIWPYCTFIRPFSATSFKYPAKLEVPVFCFTNTYKCGKRNKPKIVSYIDGPFISTALSVKERQEELHRMVYNAMKQRAQENSTYQYIIYKERTEAEK